MMRVAGLSQFCGSFEANSALFNVKEQQKYQMQLLRRWLGLSPTGAGQGSATRGVFNSKEVAFSIKRLLLLWLGWGLPGCGHRVWLDKGRHRRG